MKVWFFTNEKLNSFLKNLFTINKLNLKKVFAIASGGDFAFNIISLSSLDEINICDIRPTITSTINIKRALFKNFNRLEIIKILSDVKSINKNKIYKKISKRLKQTNKHIFDNCKENNFLKCLKKSKIWYNDSFWQIKDINNYLFYLANQKNFEQLYNNLDKIKLYNNNITEALLLFENNNYDLIYVSNIFDGRTYCENEELCLNTIKNKLKKNAYLLVSTFSNTKKVKNLIKNHGFELCKEELNKSNFLDSFKPSYSFSFLLFRNTKLKTKESI
ncbi:hypothetical protein KKG58_01790 [Patescibacteria group bacterium]|nr:hypothetical protein [Patescibacteria group bacterium]